MKWSSSFWQKKILLIFYKCLYFIFLQSYNYWNDFYEQTRRKVDIRSRNTYLMFSKRQMSIWTWTNTFKKFNFTRLLHKKYLQFNSTNSSSYIRKAMLKDKKIGIFLFYVLVVALLLIFSLCFYPYKCLQQSVDSFIFFVWSERTTA